MRTAAEVEAAGRVTVAANAEFVREPEGDAELPGVTIIAYAAEL